MSIWDEREKRIRGLIEEGIKPNTIYWTVRNLQILKDLTKEYDIRFKLDIFKGGFESFYITLLAILLKKFYKIPTKKFFEMDGHKFLINEKDNNASIKRILNDYLETKKKYIVWEPETTKIIKEMVKKGDTVLDIGASIGYFTLLLARQVEEKGRVYSFEPTTNQFSYLLENIKNNGYESRVNANLIAAWDENKLVKVPVNSSNAIWANGVSLGDFLKDVEKIDFIKLDVDGPEPRVLKGLIPIFEKNPNLKMVIEYYPKYIINAGCSPKEFIDILNKYFSYKIIPGDYSDGCWNYYCERKNEA